MGDMTRVAAIVTMLLSLHPGMGREQAQRYAALLAPLRDPAMVVTLVEHESRWRPAAESADGEDIGLGQIRARYVGACRHDPDPVHNPRRECLRVRESLRYGEYNLRLTIAVLTRWRKTCRKQTGRSWARDVLSGYAGLSRPSKRQWCGRAFRRGRWVALPLNPAVADVLRLRARLLRSR